MTEAFKKISAGYAQMLKGYHELANFLTLPCYLMMKAFNKLLGTAAALAPVKEGLKDEL